MECPHCGLSHAAAARFCARCGTPLHPHTDRNDHFAVHPDEPVRALALMSTLLPHLSGRRHHVYRNVVIFALLLAFVAAGFGVLAVALVVAAIALPAIVLTYLHDHHIWRSEPLVVVGGGFVLALILGILVGLLQRDWATTSLLGADVHHLPPASQILKLGVVIPILAFIASVIGPFAVTSRPSFRHPLDAVNMCTLSGAAVSLGLSIVVQVGAFQHIAVDNTDPGRAAFIAITLGFLQPIIFASGAALAVMPVRHPGRNIPLGAIEGLLLIIIYDLVTVLLGSYGARGVVLTAVVAAVLAAIGLLLMRIELHDGLIAEARRALDGDARVERAATEGQVCAHCGVELATGAAFCQVCGTAVSAQARPPDAVASAPSHRSGGPAVSPSAG